MRVVRMLAVMVLAGLGVTACVKPPPPPPSVTLADLDGSFTGTSHLDGGTTPCTNVHNQVFDAEYEVDNAAKQVRLHIDGCIDAAVGSYAGPFTIDTDVGTMSGTASGPVDTSAGFDYDLKLKVTSGTGQFSAERGTAHVSIVWTAIDRGVTPITGSLTAD